MITLLLKHPYGHYSSGKRLNSNMSKFDKTVESLLEEGILSRAEQKIKNIGRSVKHPFSRAFGGGQNNSDAVYTTVKGYKRFKMFEDVMKNSIKDLMKLGVIDDSNDVNDILGIIHSSLIDSGHMEAKDEDLSDVGKTVRNMAP